jgi:hypothetical protein
VVAVRPVEALVGPAGRPVDEPLAGQVGADRADRQAGRVVDGLGDGGRLTDVAVAGPEAALVRGQEPVEPVVGVGRGDPGAGRRADADEAAQGIPLEALIRSARQPAVGVGGVGAGRPAAVGERPVGVVVGRRDRGPGPDLDARPVGDLVVKNAIDGVFDGSGVPLERIVLGPPWPQCR